jgi:hypothetical protein
VSHASVQIHAALQCQCFVTNEFFIHYVDEWTAETVWAVFFVRSIGVEHSWTRALHIQLSRRFLRANKCFVAGKIEEVCVLHCGPDSLATCLLSGLRSGQLTRTIVSLRQEPTSAEESTDRRSEDLKYDLTKELVEMLGSRKTC